MSTFRVPPRKHFTLLSNLAVRDPRTSYKAKGLLGTMLSFDPDWVFHKNHLLTLMKERKAALGTGLKELREAGYVVLNGQKRSDRGHFGNSDYDVYDYPHGNPLPPEAPDPEATMADAPEGAPTFKLLADHRYVKVRNAAVRDPELTCKAKGILLTMLSFPPGWAFSQEYLENFATDRVDSIRTGINELTTSRYIVRLEQQRNDKGYFGAQTYIVADYQLGTEADPQRDQTLELMTVLGKSAHGGSVLGKSAHGESVIGKSVHGKSAPKKTVPKKTVEKKTVSKKSSSVPAATASEPTAPSTTTQGERKGLNSKIQATFKALLPHLLSDDPRRKRAWNGLSAEQQDAAFRRAQERKKEPHEQRAFSTVLKEELDIQSGLARPATTATNGQDTKDSMATVTAAQQRWEEVFAAALDEGLSTDEATQLADKARQKLLAPGYDTTPPEGSTTRAPSSSDVATKPQVQRGLTGTVLLMLSSELMKLYKADRRRFKAWGKLTQDEQERALRRAQVPNKESGNDKALVKALVAELDVAAGLSAARGASEQSAVIPKGDRL